MRNAKNQISSEELQALEDMDAKLNAKPEKPEKIRIVSSKGEAGKKVEIGWDEFLEINKKIPLADECDLEELSYGDSDFHIHTILSYHKKDCPEFEVGINLLQKYIPLQELDNFWDEFHKSKEEKQ